MLRWSHFLKLSTLFNLRHLPKISIPYQTFHSINSFSFFKTSNLTQIPKELFATTNTSQSLNEGLSPAFKEAASILKHPVGKNIEDYQALLDQIISSKKDSSQFSKEEATIVLCILFQIAKSHHENGNEADALKHYEAAFALAKKAGITDTIEMAHINNGMGIVLMSENKLEEAEQYLNKASRIFGLTPDISPKYPILQNTCMRAVLYNKQELYNQAEELFNQALQTIHLIPETAVAASLYIVIFDGLGYIHYRRLELEKAIEYWNKSLDYVLVSFGKESVGAKGLYEKLAWAFYEQGQYTQALEQAENFVVASEKNHGEESLEVAPSFSLMGRIYYKQEDYDKALEIYGKLLNLLEKHPNENQSQLAETYMLKAKAYFYKNDENKVLGEISYYEEHLEEALTWFNKCLNLANIETKKIKTRRLEEVYSFLAGINLKQNKEDESLKYYEKAVEACEAMDNISKDLDVHYHNLGTAYEKKRMFDKASQAYKKAVDSATKEYGKDDPRTQGHLKCVLDISSKLDDHSEALKEVGLSDKMAKI